MQTFQKMKYKYACVTLNQCSLHFMLQEVYNLSIDILLVVMDAKKYRNTVMRANYFKEISD